jgi:hypothetical protein
VVGEGNALKQQQITTKATGIKITITLTATKNAPEGQATGHVRKADEAN